MKIHSFDSVMSLGFLLYYIHSTIKVLPDIHGKDPLLIADNHAVDGIMLLPAPKELRVLGNWKSSWLFLKMEINANLSKTN